MGIAVSLSILAEIPSEPFDIKAHQNAVAVHRISSGSSARALVKAIGDLYSSTEETFLNMFAISWSVCGGCDIFIVDLLAFVAFQNCLLSWG